MEQKLDDTIMEQIDHKAQDAWGKVWGESEPPAGVHSGAVQGAMEGVEEQANQAYNDSVRESCKEYGIDERDYWRENPVACIIYEPGCMADEMDAIRNRNLEETDLGNVDGISESGVVDLDGEALVNPEIDLF